MSNTIINDKIEKRRIYMRNYRLKKAGKLVPIKEVEREDEDENEVVNTNNESSRSLDEEEIIPKEIPRIKYLLIKPDFTLLIKHNKLHIKIMKELLIKTKFLQWLNKYDLVMMEFKKKRESYIEYNDYNDYNDYNNYEYNSRIIRVLVSTTSFIKWLNVFDLVMDEFIENQL